jgi:hypothetical protein
MTVIMRLGVIGHKSANSPNKLEVKKITRTLECIGIKPTIGLTHCSRPM